jgi:hypothetical protein
MMGPGLFAQASTPGPIVVYTPQKAPAPKSAQSENLFGDNAVLAYLVSHFSFF